MNPYEAYRKSLKVHYRPFKNSPEVACLMYGFPTRTTRNFDKVTCKTCRKANWYMKGADEDGIIRLKKGRIFQL